MKAQTRNWIAILGVVIVAIAVVLLWPPRDPLAGVETVAIRVGDEPPQSGSVHFEDELRVVLDHRNIRIVSDETSADVVLSLDDFRVNLGDIQISLTDGTLRGEASAECTLTDLESGREHIMDFHLVIENGDVRASLTARRFWEFWK